MMNVVGHILCFRLMAVGMFSFLLFACGGEELETPQNTSSSSSSGGSSGPAKSAKQILGSGKSLYVTQCEVCHGPSGSGVQGLGTKIFDWSDKAQALVDKILISMPSGAVDSCDLECSKLTAAYILSGYNENGTVHPDISFEDGREVVSSLEVLEALADSTASKVYGDRKDFSFPALIQAEHFDTGGEGVSFSDTTPTKNGDATLRPETSVDIESNDGRVNIGWTSEGEWLEYSFYLEKPVSLQLVWSLSSKNAEGRFRWSINGKAEKVESFKSKSDWYTFLDFVSVTPLLDQGWHTMRVEILSPMNLDHFTLRKADHQPVDDAQLSFELPAAIIHRLTNHEYLHTVNNLFGGDFSYIVDEFLSDPEFRGFSRIAEGLVIEQRRLEQYYDASLKIAADVISDNAKASRVVSCALSASTLDSCGDELVSKWGLKITRHPLSTEDKTRYMGLLQSKLGSGSNGREAFEFVLSHMLFSASFLHHIEVQPTTNAISPIYTLSPYELANRLSYFLWCSAPDDALYALAESGEISDTGKLIAEVERMLGDQRSRCLVDSIADQWLNLKKTNSVTAAVTDSDYPGWKPSLADDMVEETKAFLLHLFKNDRPISEMLTADYSFMSKELAAFYDLGTPNAETGRVDFPSNSNRKGLLTHGSILTLTRSGHETFIHRGILILDKFLCSAPPPPPEDLAIVGSTEQDACQGCHKFINPPGSALNHYDEVGRFKTVDENGMAISAEGNFFMGPSFTNAMEMISIVESDERLAPCVLDQFFGYAIASVADRYNKKAREDILAEWGERGFSFQEMLVAIVTSPSFQYRRISAQQ